MITIWRSTIWRRVGVVMLAAGVVWLLLLMVTGCVAKSRTVNRAEIPEHIVGEPTVHNFDLAGYTDEGILVRHSKGTVGYAVEQMMQVDMEGRRRMTSPESENLFLVEGHRFDPPIKELRSPDGRNTALITKDGGWNDYYWLELKIRDNTTLATRQLYPPLRMTLRCPLLIDYRDPHTVTVDVQNFSPRQIPATIVLSSPDLSISEPRQSAEFAPHSVTPIRWQVRAEPSHPLPGGFADIEVIGSSEGFGLVPIVRQVCSVGAPIQTQMPGVGLALVMPMGLALTVIGIVVGYPLLIAMGRGAWGRVRTYRFRMGHILVVLLVAVLVWLCVNLLAPWGYRFVVVPDNTIPILK